MPEEKKKGLLGWAQDALKGITAPPAPKPAMHAAKTQPLQGDRYQRGTTLSPSKTAATTPLKKSSAEEAAESKKRMAFIMAYLKNPEGDPSFKDRALVFRILTEERSFQQNRIIELQTKLRLLPPLPVDCEEETNDPERLALEKAIEEAQTRQAQIYSIMKRLTGVRGRTGGTGFLTPPGGG